jgi:hypothetical protein
MMTGPTQPEMGRLRVSDGIRRSEANRRAAALSRARGEERRARLFGAVGSLLGALRSRPVETPQPVRPAAMQTNC